MTDIFTTFLLFDPAMISLAGFFYLTEQSLLASKPDMYKTSGLI